MEPAGPAPSVNGPMGEAHLGPWKILPTGILLRHHKAGAQRFLLVPPPGFSGQARLGVIAEGQRNEFARAWDGRHAAPLLFSVPLPQAEIPTRGRADLLLEAWASGASPPQSDARTPGEGRWSGALSFLPASAGGKIDFCPLLAPPSGQSEIEARGMLEALIRALERGKKLRAGAALDWTARVAAGGFTQRVEALASAGRLEFIATGPCEPATLELLRLPTSIHGGWILQERADIGPADLPAEVAGLILPPAAGPAQRPFHFRTGSRDFIAHDYSPGLALGMIWPEDETTAVRVFDELLHRCLHWRSGSAYRRRIHALGFLPLPLREEQDWKRLGSFVGRWNRRHLSPQLVCATPSDYFAAVQELETEGIVRLSGEDPVSGRRPSP